MAPALMLAIIDLTAGEVMIILVFALIVLGPERLPEIARSLGKWAAKGRKLLGSLQAEMRDVLDDPAMQPLKDVGEFVAQPRKKLTELALAAEAEAAAESPESTPTPSGTTKVPPTGPTPRELAEAARHASADATPGGALVGEEPRVEPGDEPAPRAAS